MYQGQMCWMGRPGERRILHLRLKPEDVWLPYNHANFDRLRKPDHPIPNGSPGYATMQSLLKAGWTYAQPKEPQHPIPAELQQTIKNVAAWVTGNKP